MQLGWLTTNDILSKTSTICDSFAMMSRPNGCAQSICCLENLFQMLPLVEFRTSLLKHDEEFLFANRLYDESSHDLVLNTHGRNGQVPKHLIILIRSNKVNIYFDVSAQNVELRFLNLRYRPLYWLQNIVVVIYCHLFSPYLLSALLLKP